MPLLLFTIVPFVAATLTAVSIPLSMSELVPTSCAFVKTTEVSSVAANVTA